MSRSGARQKATPKIIASAERVARALELRKAGNKFADIGKDLGITPQGAHKLVMEGLRNTVAEPAQELRVLEFERLDHMLSAIWPKATEGDLQAQAGVLRLMERRARLLGIDAAQRAEVSGPDGGPVLVGEVTDAMRAKAIAAFMAKTRAGG